MKCLIVYAHPEDTSFNAAMKDLAVKTLTERGWEVALSDLYRMKFKTAADGDDFLARADPGRLNYLAEQKNASQKNLFVKDIVQEQQKVRWADFILLQFPVWWFSAPAVLKGWFDRVLAAGFAWDFGSIYDSGLLAGKKAMAAVTTGGPENFYRSEGPNGASIEQVLYGINHGTLYFCGIQVLPPFAAYSVFQVTDEKRKEYLAEYKERLMRLSETTTLPYPRLADFDENFRLRKK